MSFMDELKKIIHPYDDEDYDYEEEELNPASKPAKESFREERREERKAEERRNKVVNIHATTQLNLESTNKDIARRLVDFLSGVAYAGEGKIKKVSANTYIITPYSVDIMGDLIDELENNGLYL